MRGRIYRQRRRILFGAALLVLTLLIADMAQPGGLSIFAGLGAAQRVVLVSLLLGFFAAVIALLIAVLPGLRPIVEVTGLAALLHTTLMFILPDPLAGMMWQTGYATVALFLIYIMVYMTLYGATMDRLPVWFSAGTGHRFRTSAPPATVWRALVPEPGRAAEHWTGTLESIRRLPDEADTVELRYALGNGLHEVQTVTFLERRPPWHCRYYFIAEATSTNAQFSEGELRIDVAQLPDGGSEVSTRLVHSAMHLRLALMMWFDDVAGDQADSLRARLEGAPDWSISGGFNRQVAQRLAEERRADLADDQTDPGKEAPEPVRQAM